MPISFEVYHQSAQSDARLGRLSTPHGTIDTPVFMPVGTQATVKAVSPEELNALDVQVVLANTYHLFLRPGPETIAKLGGLHTFMHWKKSILTDSGGYQVFSLAKLRKLTEEGVDFQSHLDGSRHILTPERAMDIQVALGADMIMCLDECTSYPANHSEVEKSLALTSNWAKRCKSHHRGSGALFGIVQGGMFTDLRKRALESLLEIGFDGYALGGLSVGEPKEKMLEIGAFSLPGLPADRPRYVMGVGAPEDLVEMVSLGADMFDCVIPTRNARNGQLFVPTGTLNISNARHKDDKRPVEEGCSCYTCRSFSRAYLRHLYMAKEILSYRLHTLHNIAYFMRLMKDMRKAIQQETFIQWKRNFYRLRSRGPVPS